jgi:hypothetical protein
MMQCLEGIFAPIFFGAINKRKADEKSFDFSEANGSREFQKK